MRRLGLIEIVGNLPECKNNAKSDRYQQKQNCAEDLKRSPSDLLNTPLAASVEGNYAPRHQGLLQRRKPDSKSALPDCAGSDKMVFRQDGTPQLPSTTPSNRTQVRLDVESRASSLERGGQARENSAREIAHGETSCDPLIFKRELLRNLQSDPAEVGSSAKTKKCVRGIAAEQGGRGG